MNFELPKLEKESIILEYGSNIAVINKTTKILNGLEIIDSIEDFIEVISLVALESEAMKFVDPKSSIKRKNLSEIIASVLYAKYSSSNLSEEQEEKLNQFILKFYKINQ